MADRVAVRERPDIELAVQLGVRPFVTPGCARCGAPLCDRAGNPRWEIVGQLTLVCLGGCDPQWRARKRKAALS